MERMAELNNEPFQLHLQVGKPKYLIPQEIYIPYYKSTHGFMEHSLDLKPPDLYFITKWAVMVYF